MGNDKGYRAIYMGVDGLRALHAKVKAGAPLPHAIVRAALNGVKDKTIAAKARKAFESIGLGGEEAHLSDIADAIADGDYLAVVRLTSGTMSDLWAAAMTAHYGPCGIHQSRLGPNGTPSAETLAELPLVAEAMESAKVRCASLLAWEQRQAARRAQIAA